MTTSSRRAYFVDQRSPEVTEMLSEKGSYDNHSIIRTFLTAIFIAAFVTAFAVTGREGGAANDDRSQQRPSTEVCSTPPAGMIGWWPGNGSGLDRAGGNNGQLINGVSFAPGKVDQAFSLNAPSQQFVSVDGASHIISNDQGAIVAWVNPTATSPFRMVAAFGSGNAGEAVGFGINEGNVRVYHHTDPFDWQTSIPVSTGVWTFLAYTWDGTTERLYKNGILVDSRARNFNYAPTFGRIGFGFINDASVFFPGLIDEVAIFNRTLTADDVTAIFGSGTAGICQPCAAQPADMIGWWPAEGNANDVQGPTFENGTMMNGAAFTQGKVGQAFSFDGIDDYFIAANTTAIAGGPQATYQAWIYPTDVPLVEEYFAVVSVGDATQPVWWPMQCRILYWRTSDSPSGYARYYVDCGLDNNENHIGRHSGQFYPINTWSLVTAVFNNGSLDMYVNGVLDNGQTTGTGGTTINTNSDKYVTIGGLVRNSNSSTYTHFKGRIDEVGIFGSALTPAEITAIYNSGSRGICNTCVMPPASMDAWWTGDGNAFDIQGPTFEHGTMMGNAGYAQGKVGQSFNLSGAESDYVEVQNAALFNPNGPFTVDGWFYLDPGAPGNVGEIATLIGKSEGSTGNGWTLYFDDRANVGASKSLKWAVGGVLEALNAIPTAGWYHVAGTWDPSAIPRSKLFVNGEMIADSGSATWNISHNGLNVKIGAMHWTDAYGQGNDRLNGKADEVEFISRALTSNEILSIYNAGSAGKCRPQCYVAPQSVVGWWKGNGDATDAIFGNNGTLVNGAGYGPGMVFDAFSLDATQQQYVTLPAAPSNLLNNSTGSITSWVNPSSVGDNDMIAVFGSGQNGEGVGLGIFGNIRIYHHTSTYDWQTNTPVSPNTWTHIAYTWDQTTERIYKNGVFAESRPRNFNYVPGNARIGYGWWNDPANYFPGKIDEVLIFNNTLSADQIGGMFAAGAAGTCAPQATSATITGRVTTPEGAGLRNATVTLNDGVTMRTVTTSSFGYYTFEDVLTGETYTVGVRSRRYRFSSRQVNVAGNVTDFDFIGQE